MKTIIKMFVTLLLAVCVLGAGYYLALANVSRLLDAGKPHWQCRWLSSGLLITSGNWKELLELRPPVKISRQAGQWIFQAKVLTVTVATSPRLRIQWKKSLSRRKSMTSGEY